MATTAISIEASRKERARSVAEGIYSAAMEGADVTDEYRHDADEYVAGRIDADELVDRTRSRYGLTD
jgi:hypothetical protein